MTWAGLYVSSLALGAAGAWAISRHGDKIGLMDCPNGRSSHCMPTPKGGGIGIFFVFLISSTILGLPVGFWLPICIMVVMAFWGDRIELSARLRLVIQLGLIAGVIILGNTKASPEGPVYFLWIVFWTVFIVGTANHYNFMDGINGIAGITGVLAFGFLALYLNMIDGSTKVEMDQVLKYVILRRPTPNFIVWYTITGRRRISTFPKAQSVFFRSRSELIFLSTQNRRFFGRRGFNLHWERYFLFDHQAAACRSLRMTGI
jgi:UDP-N-acetylmuramyl pentapeptide phosphotransferase/UDP-N-acetylglucosamine-1-phosphate transferase